jgi:hypothetical protein
MIKPETTLFHVNNGYVNAPQRYVTRALPVLLRKLKLRISAFNKCIDIITSLKKYYKYIQGGSNMTGTNCDLFTHNQSRSYLNHLVYTHTHIHIYVYIHIQGRLLYKRL